MNDGRRISTLLAIAAGLVLTSNGSAAIIHVPGDFATIQNAIFFADHGDEIIVAPGTYNGVVDFLGKAIHLHSESGDPADTILNGQSKNTVVFDDANGAILEGFTITGANGVPSGLQSGGGVLINLGSPTVRNCIITGNSAIDGGGMYMFSSAATVTDCTFIGNTAVGHGAGMRIGGVGSPTVTNCTFIGNTITDPSGQGGGLYVAAATPTVTDCTFIGNCGARRGGGMLISSGGATVTNCLFIGNSAPGENGGGLFAVNNSSTVTNCTFIANSTDAEGGGGGIYTINGSPKVRNCILLGNSPDEIGFTGDPLEVSFSNVQGGLPAGATDGGGNIDVDPLFVDADGADNIPGTIDDDLRLDLFSPCIDAGDNTVWGLVGITTDLDGNPRFFDDEGVTDTGNGLPPIVDMGAYERPTLSDCNGNGVPDCEDVDPEDPDGDGVVWDDYNLNGIPDVCDTLLVGDATWTNPAGGLFRLFTNWDTDTPGPANGAIFDLSSTYTVTFDEDVENTSSSILDGLLSLDLAGFQYSLTDIAATSLVVGSASGASPSLTMSNGSLQAQAVIIADGAASFGELHLSGVNSIAEDLVVARLGNGLLEIRDASLVDATSVTLGQQAGSFGRIVVDGPGSQLTTLQLLVVQRGRLEVVNGGQVSILNIFGAISLFDEGELTGDGTINGNILNVGTVTPQDTLGGPASLTVVGSYQQTEFLGDIGTLSTRIGPISHSMLDVSGQAVLGGGLFVELVDPFDPPQGQTFNILTAPTISGQFDIAFMPGLSGGKFMRVEYGPGAAPGPFSAATIVVDDLLNLFGFGDPESVGIEGLPSGVAVGDFDNQNGVDLAITIPDADSGIAGTVLVLLNAGTDGSGNWLGFSGSTQTTVGRVPSGITVGFFDADANLDIAVTNAGDDNVSVLINDGLGLGTFNVPVNVAVGTAPSAIAAGDFGEDGSGDIDLAVANEGDNTVQILTNDGMGTFNPGGGTFTAGTAPRSLEWDDIDDNKDLDLVVANHGSNDISVFLNAGGGSFDPAMNLAVGDGPVDLATADLDLDLNGTPDIITANNGDGTVSVILNNGDGTFVPAVHLPVGALPRSLTPIDLEGDLDFDIAVVADNDMGEPVVQVLRNDLTAGQLIFAAAAELVTGTDPAFVITGDLDGDLDEDLITVNEGLGAASGAASTGPPGPAMGSVNVSLNALVTPCPPDVNGDGVVNVLDLIDLLLCFGQPAVPGCSPEDVNGDGTVNVLDLIDLLLAFGTACP